MKVSSVLSACIISISMIACDSNSEKIQNQVLNSVLQVENVIIDFEDDVTPGQIRELEHQLSIDVIPNSDMYSSTKITLLEVDDSNRYRMQDIVDELEDSDLVEGVELDQILSLISPIPYSGVEAYPDAGVSVDKAPNDPMYNKQWHMRMVRVEEGYTYAKGNKVIVAVLDTGISDGTGKYRRVPDLKQTCMVKGRNFTRSGEAGDPYDWHGHGTHVGGTIAQSTNNGIGVVGVALDACLMPVKVLDDSGSGSIAGIAEGIRWAVDNGAQVINMSLGGGGFSRLLEDALNYAVKHNVFVACAAGNGSSSSVEYPAAQDGCQAISSVGKDGELAFYSSYGTNGNGVFIAAPGGDQQADGKEGGVWQDTIVSGKPNQHGYFPFQGTSMATPHVAGAAAVVISNLPKEYTLDQVRRALLDGATSKEDTDKYGGGLLNVGESAKLASETNEDYGIVSIMMFLFALSGGIAYRASKRD